MDMFDKRMVDMREFEIWLHSNVNSEVYLEAYKIGCTKPFWFKRWEKSVMWYNILCPKILGEDKYLCGKLLKR